LILEPSKNIPIGSGQNIPLALLGQCVPSCSRQRRYTKAREVETLAVNQYKKNGKGITYRDLLSNGLAFNKAQAQITLKHCLARNVLFTLGNYKPQQYYPICIKSEISKKNIPIGVTGVGCSKAGLLQNKPTTSSSQDTDPTIVQTLEGYVLPLLPKAPLHIHKMQFKVRIPSECYQEIGLPVVSWNKGKQHEEIVGRAHVRYCFYANGTIMVFTESSNAPFKLEDEFDLSRLIAFFGQVRDRLVVFLADKHERIVPDIMSWELTQWDLNKDVIVDELTQIVGSRIQIRHACHLFRIYIKSRGKDTVCRVEQSFSSKDKPVIEIIKNIFSPGEQLEKQLADIDAKVDQFLSAFCNDPIDSTNRICSDRFPKDSRCSAN
jgi:hypothetical protein